MPQSAPAREPDESPTVKIGLSHPLDLALGSSCLEFIDYYDKNLAGLMVWFDSDENDYRRRVLPLAASTPGVRYAVAAIAAHHGTLASEPQFPEAARDACLGEINAHIAAMTSRLSGGSALNSTADMAEAEWILASILMISCYEMTKSQVAQAEGHRRAARRLVNVFQGQDRDLFRFLQNQLSIYDVLAATTSFDISDVEETVLPPSGMEHALFAQYLTLLHSVTVASRRNEGGPDAATVRGQFEQARGATLLAAGNLRIEPDVVRRDFIRLVDIYHQTAILYSYRCLGYANHSNSDWKASIGKLFDQLAALENAALCAHNLPWPAFIAGAESHDDEDRQKTTQALLTQITSATGFKNHADIAHFLHVFWAGSDPDWRPLARHFQESGCQILPV